MKILGLIVEYNPFHYGHLYHLQAAKKKTEADLVVAVMSGTFLQRGEPACASKWARTRMALQGGADLIIELPYIYSTQKAEIFATGAVSLLQAIGANQLCFGSESGKIELFNDTLVKVAEKEQKLNEQIKKYMKMGHSYPKSYSNAFQATFPTEEILDLSRPNNILGYHYVKAIQSLDAPIKAYTIKREKAGYHDEMFQREEKIASATAIRKKLTETKDELNSIKDYVPSYTKDELEKQKENYGSLPHWEDYFPYLQYKLMTSSLEELQNIYECEEGLQYRLKKFGTKVSSFHQLMEAVKTKRYTWTRIQRLFVHLLMNTTKSFMNEYSRSSSPAYIRILGMSEEGQDYLSKRKKQLNVPLVTRASEYDHPVLKKDILASQVHALPFIKNVSLHDEFTAIPIRYNKKEAGTREVF